MAVIHISEAEAAKDFPALLRKARTGEEIIIEDELGAVRLSPVVPPVRGFLRPRYTHPRLLSEILADLEKSGSDVTLDDKFGSDLEEVIRSHEHETLRDPWEAS